MKKYGMFLICAMLSLSLAGCGDPCKDNFLTGIGDSLATFGKKDLEKQRILAERQSSRAAACAKKKGSEMKKNLGF